MNIRTDLALEQLEISGEILPEGVTKKTEQHENVNITRITVDTDSGAKMLGKPKGNYITIEMDSLKGYSQDFEKETKLISQEISKLLPESGLVLGVGLGNSDITPDDIGPQSCKYLLATRHLMGEMAESIGLDHLRPVAVLAPGVLGQTGMETAEIIHGICDKVQPSAVIVIDALASRDTERLGRTIQISDTGITPGSGVQNSRKELSKNTLNVPVIAVGVPTVVDMTTIAYDLLGASGNINQKVSERGRTMMVTPREIDLIIKQSAKMLAMGVNCALQPSLTVDELIGLTA